MRLIPAVAACMIIGAVVQPAFADCPAPQSTSAEDIPDGSTASREQMVAAQKAVKAYDTAVREYTECLQKSGSDGGLKQDQIVAEDQQLAARFNEQLHAYEAKHRGG